MVTFVIILFIVILFIVALMFLILILIHLKLDCGYDNHEYKEIIEERLYYLEKKIRNNIGE